MKIAFTASGAELSSAIDMRFGRAACFIVFSLPEETHEAFKNDCKLNAVQGAGIQAAEKVASFGAEALVTGHCGPKAFKALSAAGVKVHCCDVECTVSDALGLFKAGKLRLLSAPDVEGHWI